MKHDRQLAYAVGKATQAKALIADLSRVVAMLNDDIAGRELAVGITDLARAEYPVIARELRARRDNLLETISMLRQASH